MIWSPYLLGYRRHDSRRSNPRPSERLVMFLVTGATGTIGRPLLEVLVNQGANVRAVTRDPQATNLPAEVEVVQRDLTRPATIAPHLTAPAPPPPPPPPPPPRAGAGAPGPPPPPPPRSPPTWRASPPCSCTHAPSGS